MSGPGRLSGPAAGMSVITLPLARSGSAAMVISCCCRLPTPSPLAAVTALLVPLAFRGRVQHRLDHSLGVEVRWWLARRELGEGGHVLLDDGGRGQHGPELLAGVDRVGGGVHVLLEGVDA